MEHLSNTIVYKLLTVEKKLVLAVKQDFVGVGITHENYITLHFIYENPGITQQELAVLNAKDKNVIVKTIDRLEKNGWAVRKHSDTDRRAFQLYVTPAGETIIHKYWDSLIRRQTEELSMLSGDEKKELDRLLEKVLEG